MIGFLGNPKSIDKMPRQTEEFKTHHLPGNLESRARDLLCSFRVEFSWLKRFEKSQKIAVQTTTQRLDCGTSAAQIDDRL